MRLIGSRGRFGVPRGGPGGSRGIQEIATSWLIPVALLCSEAYRLAATLRRGHVYLRIYLAFYTRGQTV